jgi:undecaprenyl-diphosphatase
MPDWLAVICLGIIEGVTEFLPVSSTGHLLLAEHWLPKQSDLFNTVIQCGTVLAVLVVFTARVKELLFQWQEPRNRDYLLKLTAAFVITGIGGLILKKLHFKLPESVTPVASATLIGGVFFVVVEQWLRNKPLRDEITWRVALAVGLAQLLAAVFPGTSRSGVTILAALILGSGRPAATEFSFLLGIPTLLAAGALQIASAFRHHETAGVNWSLLLLASAVAAVVAFGAVKWLLRFVQSHTFAGFGWYRIALGIGMLALVR